MLLMSMNEFMIYVNQFVLMNGWNQFVLMNEYKYILPIHKAVKSTEHADWSTISDFAYTL